MKKVLITGSEGFLGHYLARKLKASPELDVWTLDIRGKGSKHYKKSATEFNRINQFDIVYHLAAISDPRQCEQNKDQAWRVNVESTRNIVHQLSSNQEFVFPSSAHVYNNQSGTLHKENDKLSPGNFYGMTKCVSERIIQSYESSTNISTKIFRLFNVYGPKQEEGFLIPDVSKRADEQGELEIRNPENKISPVYVEDVIEILSDFSVSSGIYNICNDCKKIKHIYEEIARLKDTAISGKNQSSTPSYLCGDNSRISNYYNKWTPFEQGLRKTVESF